MANWDNKRSNEVCAICESTKLNGMHLHNIFICSECENTLIHTEATDPLYEQHVERLKKINISEMYS